MLKKLKEIEKHYIICGYGRIGQTVAKQLHQMNIPFVIIDSNPDTCAKISDLKYLVVEGDATHDGILLQAGIDRASGIVTCMRSDADNLFVTLAAKEFNPESYIIVRGNSHEVEDRMLKAGADTVAYPLQIGGEQIARSVAMQVGVKIENELQQEDIGLMGFKMKMYRHYDNETITIRELLKKKNAIEAIAIKPEKGFVVSRPGEDIIVSQGDSVTLLYKQSEGYERKTMRWTQELSVGIPRFDEAHKHLIDLMNQIENANKKDPIAISNVFSRLLDYVDVHFLEEEEFFKNNSYPHLQEHMEEHARLTKKIKELYNNKYHTLPSNVGDFLKSWIKNHILVTDKKYAEFYSDKN